MINLNKISKIYSVNKTEFKALDDINMEFPNTGLISIFGRSGSGKTTLLNIIAKHETPTAGELKSNINYDTAPIVFQDTELLDDLDVKSNLMLIAKMYKKDFEQIEELLKTFELSGYENKKVNQLSAGEKQRIAIIRALLADSPVLLCDEPTANLDYENAMIVVNILKKISTNRLVIVATHDVDIFKEASFEWYSLSNGKIVDCNINSHSDVSSYNYQKPKFDFKSILILSNRGIKKNFIKYIFLTISLIFSFVLMLFSLNVLCLKEENVKIHYNNKLEYKEFELIYNHDKNKLDSMIDYDCDSLGYDYIKTIYIECKAHFNRDLKIGDYIFRLDESPYKMICGDSTIDDNEVVIPSTYADDILTETSFTSYEQLIGHKVNIFKNENHISGIYDSSSLYRDHMPILVNENSSNPSEPRVYTSGRFVCYDGEKMTSLILESNDEYTVTMGRTIENENEILIGLREARELVGYDDEKLMDVIGTEFGTYTFAKPTYYQFFNTTETLISDYKQTHDPITFTIVGIYFDYGVFIKDSLYNELADNYLTQEYRYGFAIKNKLEKKDYKMLSDKNIIDCTQYTEVVHDIYKDVNNVSLITSGVGAFLLIISICILCNYYSLSQTKKNKEVGVLASFGIKKNKLLIYMCLDIILSAFISIIISNLAIPLINKFINDFSIKEGYSIINAVYYSGYTIIYSILIFVIIVSFTILFSIFKNRKRNIVDMIYDRR